MTSSTCNLNFVLKNFSWQDKNWASKNTKYTSLNPHSRTQKHRCFPHHFPFCIISASINISGHLPVGGASGVSCGHLTHNVCRVFYLPRTGHSPLSSPCFPWFPNDTGPGCTSGLGAQSSGTGVTEHGARQEYLYRISELLLTLAWQTTFMLLNVTMTA